MVTTCSICGWAFEAPEGSEDGPRRGCMSCRDQAASAEGEPAYQSDLRDLLVHSQKTVRAERDADDSPIEVPASVREAIRNAAAPIFAVQTLPARATARRPHLKLAAFPVVALALVGAVIRSMQGSRPDEVRVAPPPPAATQALAPPDGTGAAPSEEPATAIPTAPSATVASAPARATVPSARPAPARPPPPPRPTATPPHATGTATAAPSSTPAPDPQSLMQAITRAVRSSSAADHR